MTLKRVYRLQKIHTYIVPETFFLSDMGYHNPNQIFERLNSHLS